jgi:hypothetical protein
VQLGISLERCANVIIEPNRNGSGHGIIVLHGCITVK